METKSQIDFEQFYKEQMPRVYNFFRYRFTDEMLAEDLTSQTFEKAWKHRYRYQHKLASFSTWIFTIAHRIAIDAYRRKKREVPLTDGNNLLISDHIENELSNREYFDQLGNLLQGLPDKEKEIIAMKYGAGLNNRQIAKVTGLSESNVGVILFRSVRNLREKWEKSNE